MDQAQRRALLRELIETFKPSETGGYVFIDDHKITRGQVNNLFPFLRPRVRQCLQLHHEQHWSMAQTAKHLIVSEKTVERDLNEGLDTLLTKLLPNHERQAV